MLFRSVDILVECWDGTVVTDTVDLDYGIDPDIDVETYTDDLWMAVAEHAATLIATECPACSPTPVS